MPDWKLVLWSLWRANAPRQADPEGQTVRTGCFQMTLAVTELFRIDELNFPDTVRITYGTFSTEVFPITKVGG